MLVKITVKVKGVSTSSASRVSVFVSGSGTGRLLKEYVEGQIASHYNGFVPQLHKRYMDDVIGVACCSRVELENYINFVSCSSIYDEDTDTELSFLDITLHITSDKIITSICYKDTDA